MGHCEEKKNRKSIVRDSLGFVRKECNKTKGKVEPK